MALTSVVAHSLLFFHLVTGLRSAARTHPWTAQFGNNDIYGGVYADHALTTPMIVSGARSGARLTVGNAGCPACG